MPPKRQGQPTARDTLVLASLATYRYLSTAQIARLHFPHPKLAQRRMRRLLALGLVHRVPVHGAARAGFHDWFYSAVAGRRAGAESDNSPGLAAVKEPTRGFGLRYAEHHRVLTDARIWLAEATGRPGAGIACQVLPGYAEMKAEGKRRRLVAIQVGSDQGQLVPDAVFVLSRGENIAALFFLEVDRGTEPLRGNHPSSVSRKLEMYRQVYDARLFEPFCEHFDFDFAGFRVAVVAPDRDRVNRFLEVANEVDLSPLVWGTTEETFRAPGDFSSAVWRDSVGGSERSLSE